MATSDAQLEALLAALPAAVQDAARALHYGLFIEWCAADAAPAGGWESNAPLGARRPAARPLPSGRRPGGERIPVLLSFGGRAAGGAWLDEIVAPGFDVNALLRRLQAEAAREAAAQRRAGREFPDEYFAATIRARADGSALLYYTPRWRAGAPAPRPPGP